VVNLWTWISIARPYRLALKYLDYKKDAYPNVHMRVFNTTIKTIGETYEEYIINAFSYTLKNMALNWYNNYMLEFPNYSFYELT
jgi:hypothetical protein